MDTYDEYYPHNYEHTGEEPNFKFNVGDRVTYIKFDGSRHTGTISHRGKHDSYDRFDIVYSVDLDNGEARWGYTHQFKSA